MNYSTFASTDEGEDGAVGRHEMWRERVGSARTQRRLREMLEIVNLMEPRLGSAAVAYAWYRSKPLDGFGGLTAMDLVQERHGDWIASIDAGVFA